MKRELEAYLSRPVGEAPEWAGVPEFPETENE